ncbi:HAMP domain-containing histidine kinase [Spiractinospora alimapuensis]|uniref:sensor histidine kinase n=1 Tax=Spiractinospora alimapuensis TaxID=2820884 RepID=UPI001F483754|nr:HAMP domain-containing sensor histidine kinase [Spiractinospora alimapuensis]QVQ55049.1 HAMP domain-containing histidine kinase [Spiractinospora alimapuensis]
MRRRMLFSTLMVAVVAVLLLGVPLGALTHQKLQQDREAILQRDVERIANQVDVDLRYRGDLDHPVEADRLGEEYPKAYISIDLPGDREDVAIGDPELRDAPTSTGATTESASDAHVELWEDTSDIQATSMSAWLGIASLSLLAIGVAVGLAVVQARQLSYPLVDLANTAEGLGAGITAPRRHRYGIEELDRVAEVLDRSAERVSSLIASERHFATDASHQLRTPLTALTMRLEELLNNADDPEIVREEGQGALEQAERLTEIVTGLLARARKTRQPDLVPLPLDSVLNSLADEWRPILASSGRELRITGEEGLTAMTIRADLHQILTALVENSSQHGAGTITVHRTSSGESVRIEVSDEGPGVPDDIAPRIFERETSGSEGTGLGLALARHIAESEGARVELVDSRTPTFALFLPFGPPPSEPPGPA